MGTAGRPQCGLGGLRALHILYRAAQPVGTTCSDSRARLACDRRRDGPRNRAGARLPPPLGGSVERHRAPPLRPRHVRGDGRKVGTRVFGVLGLCRRVRLVCEPISPLERGRVGTEDRLMALAEAREALSTEWPAIPREVGVGGRQAMSAPLTRTQRLVAGIALLMVCPSFNGARSGRGSRGADDEHRWHKGPVDGTAVLGSSTATPLSPLLPAGTGRIAVQPT